jgi:integrase
MKSANPRLPSVFLHKRTGQSAVCLRAADGVRKMIYLGPHGSAEAKRRYREVIAAHLAGGVVAPTVKTLRKPAASDWPTVGQLAASYLVHAERFYVDENGKPTGEVTHAAIAFRALLDLLRDKPTDRVTIRDLLDVRQSLVDLREQHEHGRSAPEGLSRRTINDRMHRMKRLFRWGVEQGSVPGAVWHELSAMRSLPKGRCGVHDNPPVAAVPWPQVERTLPFLTPTVRAAVELQWWCGARPAEVLNLTRRQLDMAGPTWLYKLAKHKGSWRGKERIVALGPKAQAILRPLLSLAPDAPVFNARTAYEEFAAAKREQRRTPPTKQMRMRDARRAKAEPVAEFFTVDEYRRAIERACDKAGVERWSPHRLRHAAGTRVAISDGVEAARALLGHSDVATTRRYAAGADAVIAAGVAARLG